MNFYFCCSLHWSLHFAYVLNYVICPLCQAGDQLVQLQRKVQALEQEKSLETTEGTLTSLRRYLNRPNSALDRFEVLDLFVLDEMRARWDSLNSSEPQCLMLGLLGNPVRPKIAKEVASILKSATKASGQTQAGPRRSRPGAAQGRGSCYTCGRLGHYSRTCRFSQAPFLHGRERDAPY